MKLPNSLSTISNWALVGPMGPALKLQAPGVLAVDGGIEFAPDAKVWIGDGDSCPSLHLPEHSFKLPQDKDYTDLRAALELLEAPQTLYLWGFLGGRRDHELAVLGECHLFLKTQTRCQILLYEDGILSGIFAPAGSGEISHSGGFSLLSLEKTQVSLRGEVLYPLHEPVELSPLSGHGISNRSQGTIKYESSAPLLFLFGDF